MTALSADKLCEFREGVENAQPVDDGVIIYAGALTCLASNAGYLIPASDAEGVTFAGVAREHVDNSGGLDGAVSCLVRRRGQMLMDFGHAIDQADVGASVYVVDDQTVDLAAYTTHDIKVGILAEVHSSTKGWVDFQAQAQAQA